METASEEVTGMIFMSKWSSQTLCAGAELGVFDFLSRDRVRTASEVAAETGLDPALLYRLLRALASIGLLNEMPGRQFNLTERGAVLRTDAPGSLRYMAMLEGGPEHWAIWKHVPAMAGDMFKEVPSHADVYSLKMILHDWNDSECTQILQTIRHRAKPDGRIFIVEHIVPGPSESHFSKLFDIHMMCWGHRSGTH